MWSGANLRALECASGDNVGRELEGGGTKRCQYSRGHCATLDNCVCLRRLGGAGEMDTKGKSNLYASTSAGLLKMGIEVVWPWRSRAQQATKSSSACPREPMVEEGVHG